MTQDKDEAREQFEHWAGGKLNLPLDRKSDGEFQLDYGYEPLNYMFVGFEAGRLAGLEQAAKAMCYWCAGGSQADFYEGKGWKHAPGSGNILCLAWPIWAAIREAGGQK
jgi:hypothetical protein